MEVLDLSHHQGSVDFYALARSGAVQAVVHKATEGSTYVDPRYRSNIAQAKKVGLHVGAYHFARPSRNTPEREAAHFCATVGDVEVVVLDIEEGRFSGSGAAWCLRWLEIVEKRLGMRPWLYTYSYWWRSHGSPDPTFARYPLWLASYTRSKPSPPKPWGDLGAWQYTSDGAVPGIAGRVDLNHWYRWPLSEEDDMTPDQARKLDELHAAMCTDTDAAPSVRTAVAQTYWRVLGLEPGKGLTASLLGKIAGKVGVKQ